MRAQDLRIDTYRPAVPFPVESIVTITHIPTGLCATATDKSQSLAKQRAMRSCALS